MLATSLCKTQCVPAPRLWHRVLREVIRCCPPLHLGSLSGQFGSSLPHEVSLSSRLFGSRNLKGQRCWHVLTLNSVYLCPVHYGLSLSPYRGFLLSPVETGSGCVDLGDATPLFCVSGAVTGLLLLGLHKHLASRKTVSLLFPSRVDDRTHCTEAPICDGGFTFYYVFFCPPFLSPQYWDVGVT